jgi:RecA/RadA recombinase
MSLLSRLREKDKKGAFTSSQTSVSYSTGFLPFDYRNGYTVKVVDDDESLVETYPSIGMRGGTFLTVVGKTGTAKTTFIVQSCFNICRKFDNSFIVYFDLEQVLSWTRIKDITGATNKELKEKFVIRQGKNYIEDIFDTIMDIAKMKESSGKDFIYDTGLKNEFNQPIHEYVPTFVVIDSIPTLASKDTSDVMEGSTLGNRNAKVIAQFYKRLMPIIKQYNITVCAVNHINAKIEINPFAKSQAQVMFLKQDESLPGGNAPNYYANNLLKFVSSTKYKMEDDGFDGFLLRIELLKSRTNKAGQSVDLVYTQDRGFDPIRSIYLMAENNGLIEGRNPYRYIKGHPELKFSSKKFDEVRDNPDFLRFLAEAVRAPLNAMLSSGPSEIRSEEEEMENYMNNILPELCNVEEDTVE